MQNRVGDVEHKIRKFAALWICEPLIIAVSAREFNLGNSWQTLTVSEQYWIEEPFSIAAGSPISPSLSRKLNLIADSRDYSDYP